MVVITGTRILGKSFAAAYKQAQASSQYARAQAKQNPNGAAGAGMSGGVGGTRGMTLDEACRILNVKPPKEGQLQVEEVTQRYQRLFDANEPKKGGSFYLQSKIVRAKERLEAEIGPLREKLEHEAELKEGFRPKIYKDR